MVAGEGDRMLPDWEAVVFAEETADRRRIALRGLDDRIWASLAAVVLLGLFLIDQLQSAQLTRVQQTGLASVLVSVPMGFLGAFMIYTHRLAGREPANPEPTDFPQNLLSAAWFSLAIVFCTATLFAWVAVDGYPPNPWLGLLLDWIPVLVLAANAIEGFAGWALSRLRPSSVLNWLQGYLSRQAAAKGAVLTASLMSFLLFFRYLLAGILAISASPISWASLGMLLGGGIALYAFEAWLGYLFMQRGMLGRTLGKLKALCHRAIHEGMNRERFLAEYEALLGSEEERLT